MPRATASPRDRQALAEYRAAWQATKQLLRQGRSLSGYERNCVFLNCRQGPFANVSAVSGLDFEDDGRAIGVTDWDHDGDLDLWLASRTGPRLRLMQNQSTRHPSASRHGFLAVRLQGTTSNRDAVGARVTVTLQGPRGQAATLVQTLRAGDAYLSQSSKWLHFGLGEATAVEQMTVRWPSGKLEKLTGVKPDNRYHVVEGTGRATLLEAPPREIELTARPQPAGTPAATTRTFLVNRIPAPTLRYRPFDAQQEQVVELGRQPLLLILWASWCRPCVDELQALAKDRRSFRDANLQILALTVDGLDPDQSTGPEEAETLLKRLRIPFQSGVATAALLDKLSIVEGLVLNKQPGLAVPTSFLIDAEGALAAYYRGPVSPVQLQSDLERLETPLAERREFAVPMSGRWLRPPRQLSMRAVGRVFRDYGYDEDYARYLQLDAQRTQFRRARATSDSQRQQLTTQLVETNLNLAMALVAAGDAAEAIPHFRTAVELQPDHAEALINLGALLGRAGQTEAAIEYLQQAVVVAPDSLAARRNLAAALSAGRQFAAAVPHYQAILAKQPRHALAHSQFGRVLLELGQHEAGARHLRRAVELNQGDIAAALALAWLQATHPEDRLRDGASAVELTQQRRAATSGGVRLVLLDVLAAGQAEQGDYAAARATIQEALAELGDVDSPLRRTFLARLSEYQQERPHRDADGQHP